MKKFCDSVMECHRFVDYFVVTGLPSPSEWQANQNDTVGHQDPVVDIAVINRTLGDVSLPGYRCVEFTPTGLLANLNHGSLRAPEMILCYRRGHDKPPIVDVRFECFVTFSRVRTDLRSGFSTAN